MKARKEARVALTRSTFSLRESAAILEPVVSFRALQSYVTGEVLRITPEQRGRYRLLELLKFRAGAQLLRAGLPSKGVQQFLDNYGDDAVWNSPDAYARVWAMYEGRFLISEDPAHEGRVKIYFFENGQTEQFKDAVKVLSSSPLRFSAIHLDALLLEVATRIECWNDRVEYVAPSEASVEEYLHSLSSLELIVKQ